jgi:trehalose/maltose transport system permease protein
MLAPALLVLALVGGYPVLRTIYESFTNDQIGAAGHIVGLANYRQLIADPQFRHAVIVTLEFTGITVPVELVLGTIIALVVNSQFRGRGLVRAAMLIPWALITVIAAQMWKLMYDQIYGVINDLLVSKLHILSQSVPFLALPSTAVPAAAAIDIWKTTPFVALLILAGLQVVPGDLYEAARVDGAGAWQRFVRITLPLLRPAILIALIFRTLDALRVYDVFYTLFGSRFDTMTMSIYDQNYIVSYGAVGYGSAISVAILVIIGIVIVAYVTAIRVRT